MKTVIIKEIKYLVMPEVSRWEPCNGCGVTDRDEVGSCSVQLEGMENRDKCGHAAIIYIHRTREAIKQYRIDRMVGRLEDAL